MKAKKKITSLDIAYLAGVSQATVSRALSGNPLVNEDTRRRVLAAAESLKYTVNKNASSLRRKHSGTLALLFFEDPTSDDSHINPFFLSMLGSITRACARQGFDLLISFQQLSRDWHADFAESEKADGIILLGYGDYLSYCDRLKQLVARGTAFVRWGAVQPDAPYVTIGCDNFQGGRAATEHLLEQGCRRVAFIGTASSHYPEFFERYRGYIRALEERGIDIEPALQVDAESTQSSGREAMETLITSGVKFDAVFAASDLIAIGGLRTLSNYGMLVPEEVALVGFDDIPMAEFVNPPLTTVLQDTHEAGEALVGALLRLIRGESAESRVLPAKLKVRRSSLHSVAGSPKY